MDRLTNIAPATSGTDLPCCSRPSTSASRGLSNGRRACCSVRRLIAWASPAALNEEKLHAFVFRAVEEVGATLNAALVVMGDKLGLYRGLADGGAQRPGELAERTGTAERYVREWLNAQAAGGFVAFDAETGRYSLEPEQTVALTDLLAKVRKSAGDFED